MVARLAQVVVVILNVAAAAYMVWAVSEIMGPDTSNPPRGTAFDAGFVVFHAGPCAALAALAVAARRFGSRALPFTLVVITLAVVTPGVLMAHHDATTPSFNRSAHAHGVFTFLVVCAQYLAVAATWAAVILGWLWRRRRNVASEVEWSRRSGRVSETEQGYL